jgi:hypothetical protein
MTFLYGNEIDEWLGFDTGNDYIGQELSVRPASDPTDILRYGHFVGAIPDETILDEIARTLGEWEECLLWVTLWGVWASGEDWPAYYAARGNRGERLSLVEKPGHLFSPKETEDLREFLGHILRNAWNATVLVKRGGALAAERAYISHDECIELWR